MMPGVRTENIFRIVRQPSQATPRTAQVVDPGNAFAGKTYAQLGAKLHRLMLLVADNRADII